MLRLVKTIVQENLLPTTRNVLKKSNQQRVISQSSSCLKKYKYALDQNKQRNNSATQGSKRSGFRKDVSEGRALTYFSLEDRVDSSSRPDFFTRKQIAYAETVQGSVEDLLTSKDVNEELQACPVEIVRVEVSPTLSSANVIWKLAEEANQYQQYTKEEVTSILNRNLAQLRLLLPAYTTITQTPCIHFTFDQSVENQNEIDKLFERIRVE